jgi:hypothetical protein
VANSKKPLSPQRKDEVFEALGRLAPMYRDRILHWLAHADRVSGAVAAGGSTYEQQALFVVRLAGIVSDLRRRFRGPGVAALAAEHGLDVSFTDELRAKLNRAIEALYAALTEDELLWLELRRHEQCHPVLDGYRPDVSAADDWNHRTSTMLDGKEISLDETIARCATLEHAAGGFVGVAELIARKTWRHVGQVQLAMTPLMARL